MNTISPNPSARLYLKEFDNILTVEVRFVYTYGDKDSGYIEFKRNDTDMQKTVQASNSESCELIRSKARENEIVMELYEHGLRPYHTGSLTPVHDPRTWVAEILPLLAEKGYEIYGHKNLISSRVRRKKPEIDLRIDSRDERFLCSISVSFDGIPASMKSLIKAVDSREKFILLNDGSTGLLPEKIIDLLIKLFSVIEYDLENDSFSAQQHHIPLLDMLFNKADRKSVDKFFIEKCKKLKTFSGIEKKTQPEGFNGIMRPYQIAGYEWLCFLREFNFGGCLADDMGLGKTIQTLALLLNEKRCNKKMLPSIVVAPTSVLFNWEREIKRFTPELLTCLYYGYGRKRKVSSFIHADIVLTSYGTLLRDIDILKSIEFNYAVLDEAQTIKNPYSKIRKIVCELKTKYRLALSGTPVENNLGDMWSIFSFINPGVFGTLSGYKKNIINDIKPENMDNGLKILKRMIFPFILRRTKKQVAKELPPKTETIVYTEMLPRQKRFYDITREQYLSVIMDFVDKYGIEKSGTRIFEAILRLRQICCHPVLINPEFQGDSGKFKAFDSYIDDITAGKHRALVFSQFESVLKLIEKRMMKYRIKTELLTGKTRNRARAVDNFKNDKSIPVFLITLKAGGLGLNLTEADYVIHIDPWWNPAAENQASDRVYRIGQEKHVFIYKLITKDSIEERVLRIQNRKKELVDNVIHTESSFFKRLTREDIISLFS